MSVAIASSIVVSLFAAPARTQGLLIPINEGPADSVADNELAAIDDQVQRARDGTESDQKATLAEQLTKLVQKRAKTMTLDQLKQAVSAEEAKYRRIVAQRKLDRVSALLEEIALDHPETPAGQTAQRVQSVLREPESIADPFGPSPATMNSAGTIDLLLGEPILIVREDDLKPIESDGIENLIVCDGISCGCAGPLSPDATILPRPNDVTPLTGLGTPFPNQSAPEFLSRPGGLPNIRIGNPDAVPNSLKDGSNSATAPPQSLPTEWPMRKQDPFDGTLGQLSRSATPIRQATFMAPWDDFENTKRRFYFGGVTANR
jgi:hypothetical protein